jgi:3-hydroxy-3-methylglutaryl CoA synthase
MDLAVADLVHQKLFLALVGLGHEVVAVDVEFAQRAAAQGAGLFLHCGEMGPARRK